MAPKSDNFWELSTTQFCSEVISGPILPVLQPSTARSLQLSRPALPRHKPLWQGHQPQPPSRIGPTRYLVRITVYELILSAFPMQPAPMLQLPVKSSGPPGQFFVLSLYLSSCAT